MDARGAFPASLFECHGHIMANAVSYNDAAKLHKSAPSVSHIRSVLCALRDCGVTYFRDGGDRFGVCALAKSLAPEYGIELRSPCFIIHREGFYGSMYGFSYRDTGDARRLVLRARDEGADFIKITVSGMLDFTGDGSVMGEAIGFSELRELVNIASGEGFSVMAHCNGADNIKNALEAGIASLEHGFWIDDEGLNMLRDTGAVWVPTLAPVRNTLTDERFSEVAMRNIFAHHCEMLRRASKTGVNIASGSDCGAYRVSHGQGTLDEYAVLRELGINPDCANALIRSRFVRS